MTATLNRVSDNWMQERNQAPLDNMKDWVVTCARELGAPFVNAVSDHIDVVKAGKRMLDEGGEEAELTVLAKKVAHDTVALDNDIIDRIQNAVDLYNEAAALLQSQSQASDIGSLAKAYADRSAIYSAILKSVGEAPQEPPMTDVEWNAVRFVQLRQAKAQLGLHEPVGGSKTGRHGSNFFNCISRNSQAYRCEVDDHVPTDCGAASHCPIAARLPSAAPSVIDCCVSSGNNNQASNLQLRGVSFGTVSVDAAMQNPLQLGKGEVQCSERLDQEFESSHNSQSLPRGDTLDTVNNCLDSLDTLKTVIDSLEDPARVQHQNSQAQPSEMANVPCQGSFSNLHPDRNNSYAMGSTGPYPGLDTSASSLTSYAIGTLGMHGLESRTAGSRQPPASRRGTGFSYKVGDPVEIFSQSADAWVKGSVVRVDGFELTVQYGDRERKVDLNPLKPGPICKFFRSSQQHTDRVSSPIVFDSMLTNTGGMLLGGEGSEVSLQPRCIKTAVL